MPHKPQGNPCSGLSLAPISVLVRGSLFFLSLLIVSKAIAEPGVFQTPVTLQSLDPAAYVEFVDGTERPIVDKFARNPGPQNVIVTQTSIPNFVGYNQLGDSKTPGPRYLRIGFTEAIPVGTLLVSGNVSVSVLKPQATYPGDLADDSQWTSAQRVDGEGQPDDDSVVTWLLPADTKTRALRFTHKAEPLDSKYAGALHGVQVLEARLANIAPLAVAAGRTSKAVAKINNGEHDGWSAWENLSAKDDRPRLIADDPEWLMLTWPEPTKLCGMALVWAGFGAAEVQTYVGPAGIAPGDAPEKDWSPLSSLPDVKNRYPVMFAPYWVDFGKDVTTRALRLRITAASGEPSVKTRIRDGKRVWLGEWLTFSGVGNTPVEAVRTAFAKRHATPPTEGAIPVHFSLPEDGFVTLVIDDAKGVRVRNLISETPFKAGEHTIWWDGSDDLGRDAQAATKGIYRIPTQPVAPGEYHVHGLWRKEIFPSYEFSVYAPGTPPWSIEDHTGGWLANHSPPQAAVFVPAGDRSPTKEPLVYLGCIVTEGPDAVAWVDLDGRKRGGRTWIGGTWTGAPFMAYDSGAKADPAVSVYVGTGWKDDNVKDSSLLRLNTLTPAGDTKPVMNVDLGTLVPGTKMSESLGGLSARDGMLVCSLVHRNELLFVDARPGTPAKETGRIPLESPRGSAFDSQGRFLVLSGTKLLRFPTFPTADAKPEILVAQGLEDPQGLALDANGNLYVSDWGASHQVKVFSASGKFLRAIGTPGEPKAGRYDPDHMNHPWGIAIDSKNQLWVAEKDNLPRRVSVWSLDGKLLNAFYGPGKYGGGGVVDPQDKTRFYYAQENEGAMEFRLDWAKGTYEPVSVYYRSSSSGLMQLAAPETPVYFKGRRYFSNSFNSSPVSGNSSAILFLERDGLTYPVAALGRAQDWDILKEESFRSRWPEGMQLTKSGEFPETAFFLWQDTNGDAQIQPDEVNMLAVDSRGVTLQSDLSFCVSSLGGTYPSIMGKTMRFAPVSFDQRGIPHYDLTKGQVLAENVKFPASTGGSQTLADDSGWSVISLGIGPFDALSLSGAKDGVPQWSYPSPWPGLHAGHNAPPHSFPGEVIATTRLLGGFFNVGKETLWAINSDQGGPYVFTRDGLFVATLFEDVHVGKSWRMPVATRGMSLKGLTLGGENFWPTITATPDNHVWLVDGRRSAIVRLDGLDTIRRIDAGKLVVTTKDLTRAEELLQQHEADRQQQQGSGVLKITPAPLAPQVDGQLDDWKSARWVEIDQRGRENVTASVIVAEGRLFAAWKTGNPRLLTNTGENPLALFKTGGALDLMIGANPNADPARKQPVAGDIRLLVTQIPAGTDSKGRILKLKTKAMLYRAVVPGTPDTAKVPFSSPSRTIYFDQVEDVSDQVQLAADKTGNFELSVPLEILKLRPVLGMKIRGDIGILRGNGSETTARVYWSNKATSIVSDVPSEAQLTPALWGSWEFSKE